MDIERIKKKLSNAKIQAGNTTKQVRTAMKEYEHSKQDMQLGLSETFKPIIDVQKETKKTIDENQDKMIDQLQKNQKALTSGLEDITMLQQSPGATQAETSKLPIDYKPAMMEPKSFVDLDAGFNSQDATTLTKFKLPLPSDLLKASYHDDDIINKTLTRTGRIGQELGGLKGSMSKNKQKEDEKH